MILSLLGDAELICDREGGGTVEWLSGRVVVVSIFSLRSQRGLGMCGVVMVCVGVVDW